MKLALLDLDNTLIDANYSMSIPETEFCSVVRELADRDIQIGLCSDSAIITLEQWAKRLGLTGPIIAERGAVLWDPHNETQEILDIQGTSWFKELRELFIKEIALGLPEAKIFLGDATKFVMDYKPSSDSAQDIFAINGHRIASFSFFARRFSNDKLSLEPSPELLARASRVASRIAGTFGKNTSDLFWDENPEYGILIVHSSSTEKWRGVSTMVDRLKPTETIMVGDSMSDFLDLPNVVQCAVGNANAQYKEKSSFVAKHPLTKGVIECLRQL